MEVNRYVKTINTVLKRRGVTKTDLSWPLAVGPDFLGAPGYAFMLDLGSFDGKIEALYSSNVLHDLSTAFGGLVVRYVNTRGFAYLVLNSHVSQLAPVDLLQVINEPERCYLVVGPRRTGKTSLLQHAVDRHEGPVVVFDPKIQTPNKWGPAEVIGAGGDYEAMAAKMAQLVKLMHSGGVQGEGRLLVIADEFWNLVHVDKQIATDLWKLVTLGAEAKVDCLIGSHSGRVDALGISGQGDLKDAFTIINLRCPRKGQYEATVDFGQGEVPAKHHGPFTGYSIALPAPEPEFELSEDEKALVRLAIEAGGDFGVKPMVKLARGKIEGMTEWRVRKFAERLSEAGLLLPEDKSVVPPLPRKVTVELAQLASCD